MTKSLPYEIPVGLIEPGDGSPETRLMGRLAAGTSHGRAAGFTSVTVHLNAADYRLFEKANPGIDPAIWALTLSDGAKVERLDDGVSHFRGRDGEANLVAFPLLTDAQYLEALTLRPGMYVVRAGHLTPCELRSDPLRRGVLRAGLHSYDTKGRPMKLKTPPILYAWDKEAMEGKAERGGLTDSEKTFFMCVMQHQMADAMAESVTASRQ